LSERPATRSADCGNAQGAACGRRRCRTADKPLHEVAGRGERGARAARLQVGGECGKYGAVTGVLIFEVTEPGFPAEQAVRIFVRFDRAEAATRALVDLEGRFFGGRTVRATFFDEGKFERQELAPVAGEQM